MGLTGSSQCHGDAYVFNQKCSKFKFGPLRPINLRSPLPNSKDKKSQFEGAKAYCTIYSFNITKGWYEIPFPIFREKQFRFLLMLFCSYHNFFRLKGHCHETIFTRFFHQSYPSPGEISSSPLPRYVAHVRGKFVSGLEVVWEVLARGMYRSPTFRKAAGSPPLPCLTVFMTQVLLKDVGNMPWINLCINWIIKNSVRLG